MTIHPKTMSILLRKLAACFSKAPHIELTEPAKVREFMDYMAPLVCEVKKQLSYITDGNFLDYDATFYNIFPQFFTPEMTYIEDNRVKKEFNLVTQNHHRKCETRKEENNR